MTNDYDDTDRRLDALWHKRYTRRDPTRILASMGIYYREDSGEIWLAYDDAERLRRKLHADWALWAGIDRIEIGGRILRLANVPAREYDLAGIAKVINGEGSF